MSIINRDLDATEQNRYFAYQLGAVANGLTLSCGIVPFPGQVKAVALAAIGLSGAPTYAFSINRFIAGAGYTVITGGATTLTATAFGTSGFQSFVLASAGSTLLGVTTGDAITILSGGGTGAASADVTVSYVIQATQDFKTVLNQA